jgi:uncharacterized protein (TIGR04255 family)
MSERLKTPPIFYSLGEIRFNQTLAMGDVIKDLQKKLGSKYPDFSEGLSFNVEFRMIAGKGPETHSVSQPRWNFINRDGTAGFIISQNSVIYQTTDYLDSDTFLNTLSSGLLLIHEHVQLAYVARVGIRTLDAIPFEDLETLRQFLNVGALGSYGVLGGNLLQSISQLNLSFGEHGTLITRVALLNGKIGVPQDLGAITLKLKDWISKIDGMHAVLDNDSFIEERFDIDEAVIEKALREAKLQATNAFKMSVTEYAMKQWR